MIARGSGRGADRFQDVKRQIAFAIDVERQEPLLRREAEFVDRHAPVEVGVSRDHGFWKVEESVPASALMLVSVYTAEEAAASASAATMSTTFATFAATLLIAGFQQVPVEMFAGSDLGRDNLLVMGDLVRIDLAVVVGVKLSEKAIGVLLHLFHRQPAVMVAVRLIEPICQSIITATARPKRLAHWAYEQPAGAAGRDRLWRGSRWRRLLACHGQKQKERKDHNGSEALASLAAK